MNRCSLCPGVNNLVPIHGPQYIGHPLFVGEAPGKDENKKLVPFIGKTGEETNRHYLPLAGLDRDDCTFTNAIKCLPTSAGGKLDLKTPRDQELLKSCAECHLYREIEAIQPNVIVPMGAFACYAIDPAIDLDLMHGFPVPTRFGCMAFPMYHPAYGIHEPKKMLHIRTDWIRLRQYLTGTLEVPVDEYPEPDYAEVIDAAEIGSPDHLNPWIPLACDTESRRGNIPHFLTYSQFPGRARLIRAERKDLLALFQNWLDKWQSVVLFHNWPYDRHVVEAMGLTFPLRRCIDTLSRAFHLGNLPQGLKAIAWRELGMEMEDFDDLVSPYSSIEVRNYYSDMRGVKWPKPEEVLERQANGDFKLKKPQSLNTRLKRFFTDLSKNPAKDVFQTWENWEKDQEMIEAKMGPWPGKCISHVPFDKSLFYACRDSDALIRAWPLFKRMGANVRHIGQENWRG